jgi:hypothetical protein
VVCRLRTQTYQSVDYGKDSCGGLNATEQLDRQPLPHSVSVTVNDIAAIYSTIITRKVDLLCVQPSCSLVSRSYRCPFYHVPERGKFVEWEAWIDLDSARAAAHHERDILRRYLLIPSTCGFLGGRGVGSPAIQLIPK